jgi:hypothetical protein
MNHKEILNIKMKMKRKELLYIIICFTILLTLYYIILSNSFIPKKPFITEV